MEDLDIVKPAGIWVASISEERRIYTPQAGFTKIISKRSQNGNIRMIPTRISVCICGKVAKHRMMVNSLAIQVLKVKYVLWAADWQHCLKFYRDMFGGVVSFESVVWSKIVIAGATLGIHGGGDSKRTWTGLSFQLDDLREGIARLAECGGSLTSEPNDTPEDPLHLAMCIDPEGNEFIMTQSRR